MYYNIFVKSFKFKKNKVSKKKENILIASSLYAMKYLKYFSAQLNTKFLDIV